MKANRRPGSRPLELADVSLARSPAVVIRLELEAAPRLYVEVRTEGEHLRLCDAIAADAQLADLVRQAARLADARRPA